MTVATLVLVVSPVAAVPPLEPTWTGRDTQLIIDRLGLSESDSAGIIAALLADYETQWVAARECLRAITGRDTPEGSSIEAVHAFQQVQRHLADVLTTDIDLILTEEQRSSWQRLQNEMWRLRRLRHGRLTGESCDLSVFFEKFSLLPEEAPPPLLLNWEAAIAPLLADREPFDIEGPSRFQHLVMEGKNEEAWQYLDEWVRLRLAIRDLTLQTVEDVAASMPPSRETAFRAAIASHILPFNARRRRIDQLVAHIRQDNATTKDTLAAVEATYTEFLDTVAALELARQHIERDLQPAGMLSQMQRRTGRLSDLPRLQDAKMQNELSLRQHAAEYLGRICALVDHPLCHPPKPPMPKKPTTPRQPILHPSGLPLDDPEGGSPAQPTGTSPLPAEPPSPNPQSPFPHT
ncbi:MAG: hypothetical protein QGG74_00075 [Phycisphaerales bacterium]|nr:hypothetical protein [Phycisphaerales bacterium]